MQPGRYRVRIEQPPVLAKCKRGPARGRASRSRSRQLRPDDLQRGLLAPLSSADVVHIVPVAAGAKSKFGLFGAILGVGLIAAAFFTGGVTLAGLTISKGAMLSLGGGLLLGGVASMLTPVPDMPSVDASTDSRRSTFSSLTNLLPQGRPVGLLYGEMMIGSLAVSQGVYSA